MPALRTPDEALWAAWDRAARALEEPFHAVYATCVATWQVRWDLAATTSRLTRGAFESILDDCFDTLPETTISTIETVLLDAMLRGAASQPAYLAKQARPKATAIEFQGANPKVQTFITGYRLDLIRQLSETSREGIRALLVRAAAESTPPAELARAIRPLIGLTDRQAQAVWNFRDALAGKHADVVLDRALRDKRYDALVRRGTYTPAQLERMTHRYAERMHRYRARVIARTESIRMLAAGNHAAWQQGIDDGLVTEERLVRRWVLARDERTCEFCSPVPRLNKDGVAFNQAFKTPKGDVHLPPLHPQCRCVIVVRPMPLPEEDAATAEPPAPPVLLPWQRIMHQRLGGQLGSNEGGSWLGADGVRRYVKVYTNPAQVWNEIAVTKVYRAAGLDVPDLEGFVLEDGRTALASTLLEGQTLRDLGLTHARASKVLDGFAADAMTANWDAVGLELDNILVTTQGKFARIDSGGAGLFRAQGTLKPREAILPSSDAFLAEMANPSINPAYARVFQAANITPETMRWRFVRQVQTLQRVREQAGSWQAFLDAAVPELAAADRALLATSFETRLKHMVARSRAIQTEVRRRGRQAAAAAAPDAVAWDRAIEQQMLEALNTSTPREFVDLRERMLAHYDLDNYFSEYAQRNFIRDVFEPIRARAFEAHLEPRMRYWRSKQHTFDAWINDWTVSSNRERAGVLKWLAEMDGATSTTYHGRWLDTMADRRDEFLREAMAQLQRDNITPDEAILLWKANKAAHQAGMRWLYQDRRTITVFRGVDDNFFYEHNLPKPDYDQTVTVSLGSIASHATTSSSFGTVMLRSEMLPLDEIVMHSLFWVDQEHFGEREVLLLGRVRSWTRHRR